MLKLNRNSMPLSISNLPGPSVASHVASLSKLYYWSTLRKDVAEYIRSCSACQRSKNVRQARSGLLRRFPPSQIKWKFIVMYFMFDLLLTARGKRHIASAIENASRQTHFQAPNFDDIDLCYGALTCMIMILLRACRRLISYDVS
jgi:hypothetical protein